MIEVVTLMLDKEMENIDYDKLVTLLDEEKQNRLERTYFKEDKMRVLFADLLVRYRISQKTKLDMHQIIYGKNAYGKPFVTNVDNLHFNVSHSGKWVVAAFYNKPLGIDVEKIGKCQMNIAERFFTTQEYNAILQQESDKQRGYFYALWTLKESYVKAVGKGLSIPLKSFNINISNNIVIDDVDGKWFLKQYYIDDHYKLAVCSGEDDFPNAIVKVTIDEIMNDKANSI